MFAADFLSRVIDARHRHKRVSSQIKLAFVHLSKCGGTSVSLALSQALRPNLLSREGVQHLDSGAILRAAQIGGVKTNEVSQLAATYLMSHEDMVYVGGHFTVNLTVVKRFSDWKFCTVLRDPIDRWLSQYHFDSLRRFQGQQNYIDPSRSLSEFLESSKAKDMGNLMTRTLTYQPGSSSPTVCVDQAIEVLRHFEVVGFLDNLDEFQTRLSTIIGKQISFGLENRNESRPAPDLSLKTCRAIEALCEPDLQLYVRAKEIFDQRPPKRA